MRRETMAGLTVRLTGGDDGDGGGDGPMVVLLHGFGAPGDDLVPLAAELRLAPPVRFAFPEAPLRLPPQYGMGRAWWMIDLARLERAIASGHGRDLTKEIPEGLPEARAQLVALLAELERRCGVDRARLVLGGFSQGAMLACDVALRTSEPLAGLVLMSGTLLCEDEWRPLMPKRAGLRVLQSHGGGDPLLPYAIAEQLRDELRGAGLELTWVTFDGGHGIAPNVMSALRAFLSA